MAVKKTNKPAASEPEKIEKLFSKEQLLAAERFQERKDIVNALLSLISNTRLKPWNR